MLRTRTRPLRTAHTHVPLFFSPPILLFFLIYHRIDRAGAVGGPIAARSGKLGELLRDLQVRRAAHRSDRSTIYTLRRVCIVLSALNSDPRLIS